MPTCWRSLLACLLAVTLLPAALALAAEPQPFDETAQLAAEPTDAEVDWGVAPVRLAIPRLGVDAVVVPVGLEEDGAMAAPTDPDTVGWYEPGWGIGGPGNAVMGGHVDWGGIGRVFWGLRWLEPGDRVLAYDEHGAEYVYAVTWSRWYDASNAPLEEIFTLDAAPQLTLITCGGQFDRSIRMYRSRLVVRAELVEVVPPPTEAALVADDWTLAFEE